MREQMGLVALGHSLFDAVPVTPSTVVSPDTV
jgi:hypothetical protein